MKKLILTLALILCGYAISNASILTKQSVELAVGSNPVSILENPKDGMIHIFCAGIDANNNNTFDEGEDEKPSWWTYNPTGSSSEANKVKEFDNYFVSPLKPYISEVDGNVLIGISYKCNTSNGEFIGKGKYTIYDTKTFEVAFENELMDSETLFFGELQNNAISITRTNGNDIFVIQNKITQELDQLLLPGDAIDFTFVDLDNDGNDEIAILLDNEKLAFYKVDIEIVLIKEIDLTEFSGYTGTFGHIYSNDKYVYTTFGNSETLLQATSDLEGNNETIVINFSGLDNLEKPSSFFPILSRKVVLVTLLSVPYQ